MSFIETQVTPRIGNAFQAIPNIADIVLTHSGKALSGVVASTFSALSFGVSNDLNKKANQTRSFAHILPGVINSVATVINPNFGDKGTYVNSSHFDNDVRNYGVKYSPGLFANYTTFSRVFQGNIESKIKQYNHLNSESGLADFAKKHLATRVLSAIFIPVAVVARVADFAIGTFILLSQVYYLGRDEHVNNRMMHHLNILAVVDDVARGIRGIFNPAAVFTNITTDIRLWR